MTDYFYTVSMSIVDVDKFPTFKTDFPFPLKFVFVTFNISSSKGKTRFVNPLFSR